MSRYIAERHLLFSKKGGGTRKKLTVGICSPKVVTQDAVKFPIDVSICHVDMEGLDEHSFDAYGTDSIKRLIWRRTLRPS